ncbi:MAG: methylmalonyl-CoA carboxyltransferase, partial [Armatimonadota bacterium]
MMDKEEPLDWQPEIEEIDQRRQLAAQMGGEEAIVRHHAAGKLTVRERVERLLDPCSFQELGSLAGNAA